MHGATIKIIKPNNQNSAIGAILLCILM